MSYLTSFIFTTIILHIISYYFFLLVNDSDTLAQIVHTGEKERERENMRVSVRVRQKFKEKQRERERK